MLDFTCNQIKQLRDEIGTIVGDAVKKEFDKRDAQKKFICHQRGYVEIKPDEHVTICKYIETSWQPKEGDWVVQKNYTTPVLVNGAVYSNECIITCPINSRLDVQLPVDICNLRPAVMRDWIRKIGVVKMISRRDEDECIYFDYEGDGNNLFMFDNEIAVAKAICKKFNIPIIPYDEYTRLMKANNDTWNWDTGE